MQVLELGGFKGLVAKAKEGAKAEDLVAANSFWGTAVTQPPSHPPPPPSCV